MQLFWTPQEEPAPDGARFVQRSRLVRFLGVSILVHALALLAAPWLARLMPAREEPVITRVVDFVIPDAPRQTPHPGAPPGNRDERAGSQPARDGREGSRPAGAPAAIAKAESAGAKAERTVALGAVAKSEPPGVVKAEPGAAAKAESARAKVQPPPATPRPVAKAVPPPVVPKPPAVARTEPVRPSAKSETPPRIARTQPAAPSDAKAEPPAVVKTEPPQPVANTDTRSAPGNPTPAAPAEDPTLAAATPKSLGSATGRARGPATVAVLPRGESSPSASPSGGSAASVLAGAGSTSSGSAASAAGTGAGAVGAGAPVATVALPPGLTGLGGSGGGAGGGTGSGAGRRGGAGGGDGAGAVDMRDPDFSEYFRLIEKRVRAAWEFPEGLGGTTQTVKIGFALGPEGSVRDVRVVSSSSGSLNDSALAAMRRAAPFPPLPPRFRTLAGQPLVMSFTVTIQ